MKDLVLSRLTSVIEDLMDDTIHKSFHKVLSGFWSLLYNIFEQVLLDLSREYIGRISSATHIAKHFDTDAEANILLDKLLT